MLPQPAAIFPLTRQPRERLFAAMPTILYRKRSKPESKISEWHSIHSTDFLFSASTPWTIRAISCSENSSQARSAGSA